MAAIPDFTSIPFAPSTAPTPEPEPRKWMTPEGVEVKNLYKPEDLEGLSFVDSYPGIAPFVRGPYPTCLLYTSPRPACGRPCPSDFSPGFSPCPMP